MDHILVVEDEVALRNALVRGLKESEDLEVSSARFVEEAVASLDRQRPSLIILDLDLPDGSGLDLLPELAIRDIRVPIVVITAYLARFQAELPDTSNLEVLAKPFEFFELKRLVTRKLEQSKREPEAAGFTVADYLQLAGMARRSVVLTIKEGGEGLGQIVVQDGAPCWAETATETGEAAFRKLAILQRAQVTCQALEAPIGKANLGGSLEHLLIDAARFADEKKRTAPAPASGDGIDSSRVARPPSSIARTASPPPMPPRPRPPPKPGEQQTRPSGTLAIANMVSGAAFQSSQEKPVSTTKAMKMNLSQILAIDASLKAVARADRQGSVLETAGEMDAETACAVVVMAAREVNEAGAEIGLGRPSAWHVSLGDSTWYVVQSREEFIVTLGRATKNPTSTLSKVAKSCGVQ